MSREPEFLRTLLAHDFPLRPDLLVRLYLPEDLTPADAKRVSRFVSALAVAGPGEQEEGT